MCEFTRRMNQVLPGMSGRPVSEMIPPTVRERFRNVIPGQCLVCKAPMQHHEMWPAGRCSRSLCQACYDHWILARVQTVYIGSCFCCGAPLPQYKVQAIRANPRAIENHMHDGACIDAFTIMHSAVVGALNPALPQPGSYVGPSGYLPNPAQQVRAQPELAEAEVVEHSLPRGRLGLFDPTPFVPNTQPLADAALYYQTVLQTCQSLLDRFQVPEQEEVEVVYLPRRGK